MKVPRLFVISLDTRPDRIVLFRESWNRLSEGIVDVTGITPSDMIQGSIAGLSRKEAAQYATFMSHRKAIITFLKSGLSQAWIAEDDAYPLIETSGINTDIIRRVTSHPGLINLAPNLSTYQTKNDLHFLNLCANYTHPPHCMHLYQISRGFAFSFVGYLTNLILSTNRLIYDVDIYANPNLINSMYFLGQSWAGQQPGYSNIEFSYVDYRQQLG